MTPEPVNEFKLTSLWVNSLEKFIYLCELPEVCESGITVTKNGDILYYVKFI
jgi:hypothetical protein